MSHDRERVIPKMALFNGYHSGLEYIIPSISYRGGAGGSRYFLFFPEFFSLYEFLLKAERG